jgi:hypothetical protein
LGQCEYLGVKQEPIVKGEGAPNVFDWAVKQGDYMALDRLLTCILAYAAILWV